MKREAKNSKRKGVSKNPYSFTVGASTLRRYRKIIRDMCNKVKPQIKTPVRAESEASLRNLVSLFVMHHAFTRDVHPSLLFNTDKVVYRYNTREDALDWVIVPKPSAVKALDLELKLLELWGPCEDDSVSIPKLHFAYLYSILTPHEVSQRSS